MPLSDPEFAPQPSATEAIERRAYVRLAVDLAATCSPVGHSREVGWPARVRDISRGGLGLVLRHRFRPGTHLTIELRAPSGAALRTVTARVAHATAALVDGSPCWVVGCSFAEPLAEDELEALR
jgi:hypothetical protein